MISLHRSTAATSSAALAEATASLASQEKENRDMQARLDLLEARAAERQSLAQGKAREYVALRQQLLEERESWKAETKTAAAQHAAAEAPSSTSRS